MNQRTYTEPIDNKNRFVAISLLVTEIGCMVAYGLAGNYRNDASALATLRTQIVTLIMMFLFVLVGFGMLLNIYRFGNWLGSTMAITIVAISVQFSPLLQKFWFSIFITGFGSVNTSITSSTVTRFWEFYAANNITIGTLLMRTTLLSCISIMVVMTAVVGRINISSVFKFTSFFQVFWNLNYFLLIWFLVLKEDHNYNGTFTPYFFDMFGSSYVYLFAAAFGLPFSCFMNKQALPAIHPRNQFNRQSLLLSKIGTGFIIAAFVFTSCYVIDYTFYGSVRGDYIARFSILFGIIGSVIGTYIGSAIFGRGRVGYKEALTGTITGGIVMAAAAPISYNIGINIMIGTVTGIIVGIYMRVLHVRINRNAVKDVVGLFGPFFIASFLGSLVIAPSCLIVLYNRNEGFPFSNTISIPYSIAGYQLIYTGISIGIGLAGGLVTTLLGICDKDYFALASNSRIYENQFGLFDLGEAAKSKTMLPLSNANIAVTPEPVFEANQNNYVPDSQAQLNRSSNLL